MQTLTTRLSALYAVHLLLFYTAKRSGCTRFLSRFNGYKVLVFVRTECLVTVAPSEFESITRFVLDTHARGQMYGRRRRRRPHRQAFAATHNSRITSQPVALTQPFSKAKMVCKSHEKWQCPRSRRVSTSLRDSRCLLCKPLRHDVRKLKKVSNPKMLEWQQATSAPSSYHFLRACPCRRTA